MNDGLIKRDPVEKKPISFAWQNDIKKDIKGNYRSGKLYQNLIYPKTKETLREKNSWKCLKDTAGETWDTSPHF